MRILRNLKLQRVESTHWKKTYEDFIDGTDEITKEAREQVIKKGESLQKAALNFTYDIALIGCRYHGRDVDSK